jgi:hypothetical protein
MLEWHSRGRQLDPDQLHQINQGLRQMLKSFFLVQIFTATSTATSVSDLTATATLQQPLSYQKNFPLFRQAVHNGSFLALTILDDQD